MASSSIDTSVTHLSDIWRLFKGGKLHSREMLEFEYEIENNLLGLAEDLKTSNWVHDIYRQFETNKGKKRLVSVAKVRDRVVHRFVFETLANVLDSKFLFDVWSGRKGKGLVGAIRRAQLFAKKFESNWVVKLDIKKFYNSVNQEYLLMGLRDFGVDDELFSLCRLIVLSYAKDTGVGMPIGNVTSQIFANIYLSGLDKIIAHHLQCRAFVRYGDDIVMFVRDNETAEVLMRELVFCVGKIYLSVNESSGYIRRVRDGFAYLGCVIYPKGRHLKNAMQKRTLRDVNYTNIASYTDLWRKHDTPIVFELEKANA